MRDAALPKISIVTPSLNQGQFVEECIQSVLAQNYPNFEHIVIDGGSTDSTLSVLERYPHLQWISEPDAGSSDALNKGFKRCSGEIVGWIGTDDRYLPNCFHTIADYLIVNLEADVVYGNYYWIDESGNRIRERYELDFNLFMLKYLHILYIPVVATFFRKQIFTGGNYLSLDYNYANDYEFILRLALQGYQFAHIRSFLSDFRWHPNSNSTLSANKQSRELERALFELDPFFQKLDAMGFNITVQKTIYAFMKLLARSMRYLLKGVCGYY